MPSRTTPSLFLGVLALAALAPHAPAGPPSLAQGRDHWAFRPVQRPAVPAVHDTRWLRSPVDAFVLARLEAVGLQPAPPADRRTLLRRVYLDLVGLPPTPEQQQAFLDDPAPDAYRRVVERLLASPQYGERWGRHWLDVVRYADSNGYERDGPKPSAYRYRDYVIRSLNEDKPYDRFLTEQLAGDELPDSDAVTQIATTFLRLGTWDDEPANPVVDRYDQLDDVLGVTATAFLGLTLRCARCHHHKFEPFSQTDYYRMLAVFEPLRRPQKDRTDLDRPVGSEAQRSAWRQARTRIDNEMTALQRRLEEDEKAIRLRLLDTWDKAGPHTPPLPAPARAAFRTEPGRRTPAQKKLVEQFQGRLEREVRAAATPEERARRERLETQQAQLRKARPRELPRAYVWYEEGPRAPRTRIFRRGNPSTPGAEVQPGLPAVLVRRQPAPPQPLAHSTGRRLWLARWVAAPDNPLTARVLVNRVWQYHFGQGLVATPNDLGVMGDRPSHPELLDWMAAEFVQRGWSLKHLHRLIVLSSAYQTSSALAPGEGADDRKLALFGRRRQQRLEAEVVRDSVLAVAGRLNLQQNGPGVFPPLPSSVLAGQSRPGDGWGRSDPRQAARRSIYVFSKRSLAVPELELLDTPDTTSSCGQRPHSTTAPQALTFLNGAFLQEQAAHFADRLERTAGPDPAAQVRLAFTLALCRPAEPAEVQLALSFLERQARQVQADAAARGQSAGDARRRALAAFCLVLLNTNEFFYLG